MDKFAKESQFSVLPVTKKSRNLGFIDSTLVNLGWSVATWCFLTGGLMATLVDFKTAILCALTGNIIGVGLASIASTIPSAKYGIDTYESMGIFLGKNGTKLVFAIFFLVNLGWVTVLASMFARGIQNIYEQTSGATAPGWTFQAFSILAVIITWLIVYKGPQGIKYFSRIIIPCLLVVTVIMVWAILSNYSMDAIVQSKPLAPYDSKTLNVIFAIELNIGAGLSWWPGLGALGRLNRNTTGAFWGNMIGLNFVCVLMVVIAVAAAFVIGGSDPTTWMIPLGGLGLGIVALLFIAFANIGSNTFVMYNSCLGLKQYNLFLNKSWFFTTICFLAPVIVLCFFPGFIYGNYQMLLNFCVALFGPLSVLQILDYMVFRKQYVDLRSLYNITSDSKYYYTKGINWGAFIIFVLSVLVYCVLLNPITWEYHFLFQYATASVPSCLFCALAYYIYAKLFLVPGNKCGYDYYKQVKGVMPGENFEVN